METGAGRGARWQGCEVAGVKDVALAPVEHGIDGVYNPIAHKLGTPARQLGNICNGSSLP